VRCRTEGARALNHRRSALRSPPLQEML